MKTLAGVERRSPAADSFRRLIDQMAGEAGLAPHIPLCSRALDILLDGFDPAWLDRNQKFDISLSSPRSRGIRFSISDFGEKDRFGGKVIEVFKLFGPDFDESALRRFLSAAQPTQPLHQTTFGFDWSSSGEAPRLKIYLEELRHQYSRPARIGLMRKCAAAAGTAAPELHSTEDLAAFCIDFLPNGERILKTYAYRSQDAALAHPEFARFLGLLAREKNAFYYFTHRHDGAGGINSTKMYKVYETRRIRSLKEGFREIYTCLAALGSLQEAKRVEAYRRTVELQGGRFYPVLFAMDIDREGQRRLDAYLSVR